MKKVITYGTFDTLHYGHILLLKRARALGDHLTVALSSDSFNALKDKTSHFDFEARKALLEAITYVDEIIPEHDWDQKRTDVITHKIDVFTMGTTGRESSIFSRTFVRWSIWRAHPAYRAQKSKRSLASHSDAAGLARIIAL
tara:strand:- start:2388 stop:2813 length:426 start_codon:yes stop_codon:yes gene_type:complete